MHLHRLGQVKRLRQHQVVHLRGGSASNSTNKALNNSRTQGGHQQPLHCTLPPTVQCCVHANLCVQTCRQKHTAHLHWWRRRQAVAVGAAAVAADSLRHLDVMSLAQHCIFGQ